MFPRLFVLTRILNLRGLFDSERSLIHGDSAALGYYKQKRDAGNDAADAGNLGIGHSPEERGIAAEELHGESSETGEDQVFAKNAAGGKGLPCPRLAGSDPQPGPDQQTASQLIQGRGVDGDKDRLDAMRER